MIKVLAKIKLYEEGRKTPFISGYRPLFNFVKDIKTSGMINLINKELLFPGQESEVIIYFLNKEFLGQDFEIGKYFTFGESNETLGDGIILQLIDSSD